MSTLVCRASHYIAFPGFRKRRIGPTVSIAARRPTAGTVLETVARHPKWRIRPRVARAVIYNPHTPPAVAVGLVHLLPRRDVTKLENEPKVSRSVRRFAKELSRLTPDDVSVF